MNKPTYDEVVETFLRHANHARQVIDRYKVESILSNPSTRHRWIKVTFIDKLIAEHAGEVPYDVIPPEHKREGWHHESSLISNEIVIGIEDADVDWFIDEHLDALKREITENIPEVTSFDVVPLSQLEYHGISSW